MFFDKHRQSFRYLINLGKIFYKLFLLSRWELSPQDLELIKKYRGSQESSVEIRKQDLKKHLGIRATDYIFGVGFIGTD